MFKEKIYYGEIWFDENPKEKAFAVLEIIDDEIVIVSNLHKSNPTFFIEVLYGAFNGLGISTFFSIKTIHRRDSVITNFKYKPKYAIFGGKHFNQLDIKTTTFVVENQAIVEWINKIHLFRSKELKITENDEVNQEFVITEELSINLKQTTSFSSDHLQVKAENIGTVEFHLSKEIYLTEAIELYNTFQQLLLFLSGKSLQFTSFNFNCLEENNAARLYYRDPFGKAPSSLFLKLEYSSVKDELNSLVTNWFNNEKIRYCAEIIIENLLSVKISHSRRFVNSYSAFEAYISNFEQSKTSVKNSLKFHEELISIITETHIDEIDNLITGIVRHRDYLVHRNQPKNKIFTDIQLLYNSYLLDYIVGINLMSEMNASKQLISYARNKAVRIYNLQSFNENINRNIFR